MCMFVFFKQKTAYEMRISDWSSDVCSSDLPVPYSETATGLPIDSCRRFERSVSQNCFPSYRTPQQETKRLGYFLMTLLILRKIIISGLHSLPHCGCLLLPAYVEIGRAHV